MQSNETQVPARGWLGLGIAVTLAVGAGAAGFFWPGTSLRADTPNVSASSAIEEALARQKRAWNDGKLEDFMAEYWKSDELTFYSGGTVTKGWQPTLDRYRKRYQGEGKEMGKLDFSDIRIDVISPDAAIVRARWNQVFSDKSQGGLFTLWMRKIDGKWKIVHDHTSAADPPKPPEPAGKKD